MYQGSRDSKTNGQVSDLQGFLQDAGYLYSDPTGYFGLLTRKAVESFQSANGITPNGLVGPYTRAKIKEVSCNGMTVPLPTPTNGVTSMSSSFSKLSLGYSSGNESSLVAYFSVDVYAGASNLSVSKSSQYSSDIGMFWIDLKKPIGEPANVYAGDYSIVTKNTNLIDNGSYWTVPVGQTATFQIKKIK